MAKTKEERVHQVFESIYDRYDQMNSIISFKRHKAWRQETMKVMNVSPGAACLDVCCGTADWTIALAKASGPEGTVIGLDFSQNMLSVGREKVENEGLQHVELIHGNAMSLPFADHSFNVVTIGFGLRNVPDYQTVLKEMYRVLKPGGQAVCLETSQPEGKYFTPIYNFYFRYIMPQFGKVFARKKEEYAWLHESTMAFPNKAALAAMFVEAGFQHVNVKSFNLGVVAAHLAFKSESAIANGKERMGVAPTCEN